MYVNRHVCSREFRDAVQRLYPGLDRDPAYWRMLEWVLYAPWRDRETSRIVMHARTIAEYVGRGDDLRNNRWSLWRFLEEFEAAAFPIARDFQTGFNMPAQMASDIPDEITKLYDQELRRRGEPRRVSFSSGKAYIPADAARELDRIGAWAAARLRAVHGDGESSVEEFFAEERDDAEDAMVDARCPEALALGNYLNDLAPRRFAKLRQRDDAALARLDEITEGRPREYVDEQARILQAVKVRPKPFYGPAERTVRLFSVDRSFLRLQTELRDVVTEGLVKCDLRSAQLAIVARRWGVPEVEAYLAQGRSIWADLMAHMGVEPNATNKAMLKDLLYAVVFGMGKKNLRVLLRASFPDERRQRAFVRFPVILSLLRARTEQFDALRKAGYGQDAYGRRHEILARPPRKGEDVRWQRDNASSVMSLVAQSYELRLMFSVARLAMEARGDSGFSVLAWLHDGCWIAFHDRREELRWRSKIGEAVDVVAKDLGIHTVLDWG